MTTEKNSEFHIPLAARVATAAIRFVCFPFVDFFFKVLNRSRAIGVENIRNVDKGLVIASNHISGVDTLLIPAYSINRFSLTPYCAPAKEELFKIPVVGLLIRMWGSFPVKRRVRDIQSMKRIAYYATNYQVMLFPEGTRSKTGELLKGRAGAGWVIYIARPVVIPTLVINTNHYFWPGRKKPWFGVPYTVVFGEPVNLDRFYEMPECKETSKAIAEEIMNAIAGLKEKHKDLYID